MRVRAILILAVFLVGCAPHIPVLNTQDNVSTTTAQSDRIPTAKAISEEKEQKLPAPKRATTASTRDTINSSALNVGSPQKWEKERAEDERKEQQLKQVIEGICRGC